MTVDQIVSTEKFEIDIYLCIATSNPKFLVKKNAEDKYEFPSIALEKGKTPKMIASKLLFDLTGLTENWTAILSIGISETSMKEGFTESVVLLYASFISETIRVSEENLYWVDYNRLKIQSSPLTLALAHEAIYRKV